MIRAPEVRGGRKTQGRGVTVGHKGMKEYRRKERWRARGWRKNARQKRKKMKRKEKRKILGGGDRSAQTEQSTRVTETERREKLTGTGLSKGREFRQLLPEKSHQKKGYSKNSREIEHRKKREKSPEGGKEKLTRGGGDHALVLIEKKCRNWWAVQRRRVRKKSAKERSTKSCQTGRNPPKSVVDKGGRSKLGKRREEDKVIKSVGRKTQKKKNLPP